MKMMEERGHEDTGKSAVAFLKSVRHSRHAVTVNVPDYVTM